jgi:hypothetical protein
MRDMTFSDIERLSAAAGEAEEAHLDGVADRLARGLRAHQRLPREAEAEEERVDHGADRAEHHVEEARDSAEREEARARMPRGHGGPAAPARQPRGDEHHRADRPLDERLGQRLRHAQPEQPRRNQRQRVPRDPVEARVLALHDHARAVRDELDHAVQRDRDEGRQVDEQHAEQRDAARHAEHAGQHRRHEDGGADRGELARAHAQPAARKPKPPPKASGSGPT